MGRIYAAVSSKGGAGKTTLVTLIAGEYALRGGRVLLIDADGRLNLTGWWKLCHSKENVPENIDVVIAASHRSIEAEILRSSVSFDVIIIDAPGVDSTVQETIIGSSELVLSPIQPGIKEIEAAGQAAASVNEINDRGGLDIMHLNVRTRITVPGRNLEAYRYVRPFVAGLQEAGYQTALLDTELFERNVYREIQNGLGTLQMQELTDPVRKARLEVQTLVDEIESKRGGQKGAAR
ncbi:ParA family protein [Rhizobium sp. SEMIA 4085]|uniref:CobQ/CobB/MinD/ParA nucleotide binding domain-containing protein n=1 Tax=Rhizobium gallicum bv. gallicum R602sp TaxID=1041138 RepID=A0A0B4XC35_9HYPH|nr:MULTISPECIES: ParA family protein [Rhizobium]AJD44148.1 CobQ/CobB/MinD/ParA nucleotide binding domain-containing protein [Rhizobium gallicum bv. gallicum R602sp]NNH30615.1 ParA family protein [Rhizobium sp. SEMIA 4085]